MLFKCDTKYCKCWLELIGEVDLRHSAAAAAVACGYRGPGEAGGRGGGRPGLLLLAADDGPLQGPLLTRPADESLIGPLETNTLDAVSPGADPAAETEQYQYSICLMPVNLLDQWTLVCLSKDTVTFRAEVSLLPHLVTDMAHRVAVNLVALKK